MLKTLEKVLSGTVKTNPVVIGQTIILLIAHFIFTQNTLNGDRQNVQ